MRRSFGFLRNCTRNVGYRRTGRAPAKLSLLGVPEQVNIPIQLCQEMGIFAKFGVDVAYTTVPEGTGAMLKKIHNNEADLAITVTDGFIAGQAAGYNVQLVGTYVDSPLIWAISTHPSSPFNSVDELFSAKKTINVGISRQQSGSHTMSYFMADLLATKLKRAHQEYDQDFNHPKCQLNFKTLGSFSNLRKGITEKDIDIFLWEVFTTKPFFDTGELKYLDEVSTPWPAFSLVASKTGIFDSQDNAGAIDAYRNRFVPALAEGAAFFKGNTLSSTTVSNLGKTFYDGYTSIDSTALIVERFGHSQFDAKRWLDMTHYSFPDLSVDKGKMKEAVEILRGSGLVPKDYCVSRLWESGNAGINAAITFRRTPFHGNLSTHDAQAKKTSSLILSELW